MNTSQSIAHRLTSRRSRPHRSSHLEGVLAAMAFMMALTAPAAALRVGAAATFATMVSSSRVSALVTRFIRGAIVEEHHDRRPTASGARTLLLSQTALVENPLGASAGRFRPGALTKAYSEVD